MHKCLIPVLVTTGLFLADGTYGLTPFDTHIYLQTSENGNRITVSGLHPSTLVWSDLTGHGAFMNYLLCEEDDCNTVTFLPDDQAPPVIRYEVCGYAEAAPFVMVRPVCRTITVDVATFPRGSPKPEVAAEHSICLGESVTYQFQQAYSYSWTPTTGVKMGKNSASWTLSPSAGLSTYVLQTTSPQGFTTLDTVRFVVTECTEKKTAVSAFSGRQKDYMLRKPPTSGLQNQKVFEPPAKWARFFSFSSPNSIYENKSTLTTALPPTITTFTCPPALTASCNISEQAAYTTLVQFLTAGGDTLSDCGINEASFALLSSVSDGMSCPQIVTRTYQISDNCGGTATCDQIVTIHDTTPPTITSVCPPALTVNCPNNIPAANLALITATDNCGPVTKSYTDTRIGFGYETPGSNSCPDTLFRVYSAIDACGNAATCQQVIRINDSCDNNFECPLCDPGVPHYVADLTGDPDGTWISPPDQRDGYCCGSSWPDRCISFTVILDDQAAGIIFDFYSGAEPSGAMFYQIECSDPTPVGDDICLPGGQTYFISFCKPGNNQNEYSITSIPGIIVADDVTIRQDCDQPIEVDGPDPSTIYWTDLTGGGIYMDYIECVGAGGYCDVVDITPDENAPQFIQYEVCGSPASNTCVQAFEVCDIVTVEVVFFPEVVIEPNPLVFCLEDEEEVTGTLIGPFRSDYSMEWFDGPDGTGNSLAYTGNGTELSFTPTQSGTYSLVVIDTNRPDCAMETFNVDITVDPFPVIGFTENPSICLGESVTYDFPDGVTYEWSPSTGVTQGADGSIWTVTPTSGSITYIVTATSPAGCATIDSVQFTVLECLQCPDPLAACFITDLPPYPTVTDFLNAGGYINYPCTVADNGISSSNVSDGNTCPEVIIRTYTITDICGNDETCEQVITLSDESPPTMTCPTALANYCEDTPELSYATFADFVAAGGTAADNCGIDETTFTVNEVSDNQNCPETITRTYQVADYCGQTAECTQIIVINDITPPTITCPAPLTIVCTADLPLPDTSLVTASDDCNGLLKAFVSDVSDNLTCPETIIRTYQATDICGNATPCTQIITINDDIAPVLDPAPADLALQCLAEVPAMIDLAWTDNCAGSGTVTGTDTSDGNTCPETITRMWTYMDACGNADTVTQIITIMDDVAPVFETPPAAVTVPCFAEVPPMVDLTWTDNCDGTGTVTGTDSSDGGTCPEIITRTWTYTDLCGNPATVTQTITIDDDTAPVFETPPAAVTVQCFAEVPPMVDLTWTDNCDGTGTVTGTDSSDGGSCPEIITRTWTYTDLCGNPATVTQTITIDDDTAPVFETPPAAVTVQCFAEVPPMVDLTWTDNCDGTGTVTGTDSSDGGSCPEIITRTWTYTDLCGNPATVTQTITIDDDTAPVFETPPAAVTVQCFAEVPPMVDLTWTDNCDGTGTVTGTDSNDGGTCPQTITRTWTYTDLCGNPATVTQTITIDDDTAPVFETPQQR
jgi:hypothetical protein